MPKILIIEDDAVTARVYSDFLRRGGFEVDVAPDGLAGLAHLQTEPPDGILVDLMMPNMNGVEFLKTVRGNEIFAKIPMFAYTTAFVPQLIQQAKDAGATEVFDKAKLNGPLLKAAFQQHLPRSEGG